MRRALFGLLAIAAVIVIFYTVPTRNILRLLVYALLVSIIGWFILKSDVAKRIGRARCFELIVLVVGLCFAALIPYDIDRRDREVLDLTACTASIIELRNYLLTYYGFGEDAYGNIKQDEKSRAVRVRTQNAKDAAYTLCRSVKHDGKPVIDESQDPWESAPKTSDASWAANNVSKLYDWTSEALTANSAMRPGPVLWPIFGVPIWL